MSERTSNGKILYTREELFTIHAAQTERQRLKNTKIIVLKKYPKKFVKESEENLEALKNDRRSRN